MEKLSWMFELLDRMSGPAERISKSLKKLDPSLKTTGNQTSLFSRIIGGIGNTFGPKAASSVLRFASSFVNLKDRLGPIAPILEKVGGVAVRGVAAAATAVFAVTAAAGAAATGLAVAGGKWLLESIAFKETTQASLEAILGSKQAAEDVFNKATKFAAKTPFSTSQVAGAFERLVSAGVEVKDLEKTMSTLGDFAGTDLQKLDSAISVIAQIKGKGKLQGEELMQLAEKGLPMGKVLDELAKKMGKTKDEVQNLLSSGKISSDQGIGAIMSVIDSTFGGRMEKSANTLEGLWSTLQSVPEDLIFNPAAAGAIEKMIGPLKVFITTLTAAFAPDTANGQRLIAMFDLISTTVAGVFKGLLTEDISKTIGKVLDVVEPLLRLFLSFGKGAFTGLVATIGAMWTVFEKLAKALKLNKPEVIDALVSAFEKAGLVFGATIAVIGAVIGAMLAVGLALIGTIGLIVDIVSWGWDQISGFFSTMWKNIADMSWQELGITIVQGIISGMFAMLGPAGMAVSKLTDVLFAGFKSGSGGGATPGAPGAAQGIQPAAAAGSTAGAASTMNKQNSFMFNVPPGAVQVNVAAGEDPAAAGKAAGDSFMGQLGAALKGMATEAGM